MVIADASGVRVTPADGRTMRGEPVMTWGDAGVVWAAEEIAESVVFGPEGDELSPVEPSASLAASSTICTMYTATPRRVANQLEIFSEQLCTDDAWAHRVEGRARVNYGSFGWLAFPSKFGAWSYTNYSFGRGYYPCSSYASYWYQGQGKSHITTSSGGYVSGWQTGSQFLVNCAP